MLKKIAKDIPAYIACILAVTIVWSWVFQYLTVIKTEEKVSIFIASYSQYYDMPERLQEEKPEYLKRVEVKACSLNDGMIHTFLDIFGYETGDILILPESLVSEESCYAYYAEFSSAYQQTFPNLGFYESNGRIYGVKIHDKERGESLIGGIDFGKEDKEEDYYLLFNRKSLHLSDLSDPDKRNEMDGAIKVAQRLLSE